MNYLPANELFTYMLSLFSKLPIKRVYTVQNLEHTIYFSPYNYTYKHLGKKIRFTKRCSTSSACQKLVHKYFKTGQKTYSFLLFKFDVTITARAVSHLDATQIRNYIIVITQHFNMRVFTAHTPAFSASDRTV